MESKKRFTGIGLLSKALTIGLISAAIKIFFVRAVFGALGPANASIDITFLITELLDALLVVFLFEILRR